MLRRLLFTILLILPIVAATAPIAVAASPAAASQTTAGIARLSEPLSDYLASLGGRVSVSVIDLGHGTRYAYNPYGRFIMASTVKVALAMAAYERSRRTGIPLTSSEQSKLTAMITRSDNNAASYFYSKIGGARGLAAYLTRINVAGWRAYAPHPGAWGWSSVTAVTAGWILERLYRGQAGITAAARSRILYLMRHVVSSQRWGVGDTAPSGSVVAVKNGWVVGPDERWAVNSTGIVVTSRHTWIVTIYTRANSGFAAGVTAVRRIARLVAAGVLAH